MNVKFTMTTASKLPDLAITNGQLIYLQDQDEAYYDVSDTRKRIGGVKKVSSLPATGREGTIYVVINNQGKADAYIWDSTSTTFAPISGYIATTSSFGLVKPDGTTITINNGVISAAPSTIAPATTASLGLVQPDGSSILVDANGVISTVKGKEIGKKRYTISAASWSASKDASGYYTYTVTLSDPTLDTSFAPVVYITGANDSTFATDTEQAQFDLLDQNNLTSSATLVLYAKTKPTSTFYVLIEGVISA